MNSYKVLKKQVYSKGRYSIVPIRMEDRFSIMKWRNEQLYHLRQSKLLTVEEQNNYFRTVVAALFDEECPNQLLFSYLEDDVCIGYGGLVHINWIDMHAEISFVMDTSLEDAYFEKHWSIYLSLIEIVAFVELNLHKIFTYAFDLRPNLYKVLETAGFNQEARLNEHCFFEEKFIDVLIHSKVLIANNIQIRMASMDDAKLLFNWANEIDVRKNSLNFEPINWNDHIKWFENKISNDNSYIFIFVVDDKPIGQIRLDDIGNGSWLIDYSIEKSFRRQGYGAKMINSIIQLKKFEKLIALVKKDNLGSQKVFNKLGFKSGGVKMVDCFELIEFRYEDEICISN